MTHKSQDLSTLLNNVITAHPNIKHQNYDSILSIWIEKTSEFKTALQYMKNDEIYNTLDNTYYCIDANSYLLELRQLAHWLIRRSIFVGPNIAVSELNQYCDAESFEVQDVLLLSGIHTENRSWKISDEIWLGDCSLLINNNLRSAVQNNSIHRSFSPSVTAVLTSIRTVQKTHALAKDIETRKLGDYARLGSEVNDRRALLKDAHSSLVLAKRGGLGLQTIAFTTAVADNNPGSIFSTYSPLSHRTTSLEHNCIALEANTAADIFSSFRKLPQSDQNRLRVTINKLNESAAGPFHDTNSAVALRTAIESLFIGRNEKVPISRTVANRAAILMGDTLEDRKATKEYVKKTYSICSNAVHSGELNLKENEWKNLDKSRVLVQKAIRKLIDRGNSEIDWESIELSGTV